MTRYNVFTSTHRGLTIALSTFCMTPEPTEDMESTGTKEHQAGTSRHTYRGVETQTRAAGRP
jgi:hypothetical protein